MKTKHAIVILLIGCAICIIGALFKIMHWPLAGLILMTGMLLEATGIVLFLYKLLKNPKVKDFLNS